MFLLQIIMWLRQHDSWKQQFNSMQSYISSHSWRENKIIRRDSLDGRGKSGRRLALDGCDWWVRRVMDGSQSLRLGGEKYRFSVTLPPMNIMWWDKQQKQWVVVVVLFSVATKHAKSVQMRVAWLKSHDCLSADTHKNVGKRHQHILQHTLVTVHSLCTGWYFCLGNKLIVCVCSPCELSESPSVSSKRKSVPYVCVWACVWGMGGYKDPSVGETDRKPPEQLILSLWTLWSPRDREWDTESNRETER